MQSGSACPRDRRASTVHLIFFLNQFVDIHTFGYTLMPCLPYGLLQPSYPYDAPCQTTYDRFCHFFLIGSYTVYYCMVYICGTSRNLRDFASPLYSSVNQDMQAAAQWWFQERMAALGRPKNWNQQDQIGFQKSMKAGTKRFGRVFMHDKRGSEEDFSNPCLLFHVGNTPEWE